MSETARKNGSFYGNHHVDSPVWELSEYELGAIRNAINRGFNNPETVAQKAEQNRIARQIEQETKKRKANEEEANLRQENKRMQRIIADQREWIGELNEWIYENHEKLTTQMRSEIDDMMAVINNQKKEIAYLRSKERSSHDHDPNSSPASSSSDHIGPNKYRRVL